MSDRLKQEHLLDQKFSYVSNYQHCIDSDCEDSKIYLGNIDLLRVEFSDNVQVNLFADVNQEEDLELRFTNLEVIITPSNSRLSQSKLKVVSQLMINNTFHKQLRRAYYALLKWHF